MSRRRDGSRQDEAAAAAPISESSADRIDFGRLQPKAANPRSRRRPDSLASLWEPLQLPLLERQYLPKQSVRQDSQEQLDSKVFRIIA